MIDLIMVWIHGLALVDLIWFGYIADRVFSSLPLAVYQLILSQTRMFSKYRKYCYKLFILFLRNPFHPMCILAYCQVTTNSPLA